MSKRKTIKIEELKDEANRIFLQSPNEYSEGRKHIQSFVEKLLMDARQYKGFRYLTKDESLPGNLPGIIFDNSKERDHVYPDASRVSFY